MTFCPSGGFGHVLLHTGLIPEPYQPFTPNILLDSLHCRISALIARCVQHRPPHGSLSLTLVNQQALFGDLLASSALLGGMATFHVYHGGPIAADEVARHVPHLSRKPAAMQQLSGLRAWPQTNIHEPFGPERLPPRRREIIKALIHCAATWKTDIKRHLCQLRQRSRRCA